jgi:hypothetical protein
MKPITDVKQKMQKKHKTRKAMQYLCALLIAAGLILATAETQPWSPWLNLAGISLFGLGCWGGIVLCD